MPGKLAQIAGVEYNPTAVVPSTIEELLTGPGLFDTFFEACEADHRRARSCASPRPSRSDLTLRPVGSQRLVIHDKLVRTQNASRLCYCLLRGSFTFDIFAQVLRQLGERFKVETLLEFEGERVSAYTISFSK